MLDGAAREYRRLHAFGAWLGATNVARHGFALGFRKTVGKVLQPVNSVSRYPEYYLFLRWIRAAIGGGARRLLDVGSPKLLGLHLAYHHDVHVLMTDYSGRHLDEYVRLWGCLAGRARGRVTFAALDARALPLRDERFDVVYSMSVIEHIDEEQGDRRALREMFRVLAPGGRLVVSTPYGSRQLAQYRAGFAYNERVEDRAQRFFFQKVYDASGIRGLLGALPGAVDPEVLVVRRRRTALLRSFQRLGTQLRGVLGGLNPWIALACCEAAPWSGGSDGGPERYSATVRLGDYYPDVVFRCSKGGARDARSASVRP